MWFHGSVDGAVWTCARSDLRRRWLSWVVLGLLAGVTVGLACAGFAGARRTDQVMSRYIALAGVPDAAVLANSPTYDEDVRAAVARLPEVEGTSPFVVPFLPRGDVASGHGGDRYLPVARSEVVRVGTAPSGSGCRTPTEPTRSSSTSHSAISSTSRSATPSRSCNRPSRTTTPLAVPGSAGSQRTVEATLRVVGVANSVDEEPDSMPSPGFYERFSAQLAGPVQRDGVPASTGAGDLPAFRAGVETILGGPVDIESADDLFGIRAMKKVADVEQGALVLFAVAALLGGGVLVGQALVRAVTAGAADLLTWRALGFDHRMSVATIAARSIAADGRCAHDRRLALALSPRFPVAFSRRFVLDPGVHADWPVLDGRRRAGDCRVRRGVVDRVAHGPPRRPFGPPSLGDGAVGRDADPARIDDRRNPACGRARARQASRSRALSALSARSSVSSGSSRASRSAAGSRPPSTTRHVRV